MFKFALLASVAPLAFMSDACETVMAKIKGSDADFVRFNKSDVDADPDNFTLAKGKDAEQAPEVGVNTALVAGAIVPPAPSAPHVAEIGVVPPPPLVAAPTIPSPGAPVVLKIKNKFVVVNPTTGEPIKEVEGLDPKGYDTEAAAFAAIHALPPHSNVTGTAPEPLPPVAPAAS